MKGTLNILLLALSFIILSCGGNKNTEIDESIAPKVEDYLGKIDSLILTTTPRRFNGVVFITQDGEIKYTKEHGFSDFEKEIPISINDNFRIQSNSKQITAVLILKEVEKGNINLNYSIDEYLPELKSTWADSVTVHQLLNMSSGIISLEQPLLFDPGKGFRYSNAGYGLLGSILESTTGKTYNDLANNLFLELGMKNTYCYEIGRPSQKLINGYWLEEGELEKVVFDSLGFTDKSWKNFAPTGGIISNVHDLNIWNNKLHNEEILSKDLYEKLTTSSNRGLLRNVDNDTIGYAYGLYSHENKVVENIGHGGGGLGFSSRIIYIPSAKVNVFILENIYALDENEEASEFVYHFENEIGKIILNSNLGK